MLIKQAIKAFLPKPVLKTIRKLRTKDGGEYRNLSTQEVFSKIYEEGAWGRSRDPSHPFFSGIGSRDDALVADYIQAVREFLSSFDRKPDVVDLGCGDFIVGSRLRHLCGSYIACDIVPQLIEFNKRHYETLDVDFRVLDLITDELPDGELVFVRQVLQHLSNEQIMRALPKLGSNYKYMVVTEHLPGAAVFEHNLDKPAGPDIRTRVESGVVLTSAPFNLKPRSERRLCQVPDPDTDGIIATTLYQLGEQAPPFQPLSER